MIVINRMATELTRLKPSIFFEQTDYQEQEQLKWAKELAAQLLLVIVELDTIVKIERLPQIIMRTEGANRNIKCGM